MSWFSCTVGPPETMRWPMAAGEGKSAGVQRIGYEFEGHGTGGQSRRLIDQLFAGRVLDPEIAQIGADAVDRALVELASVRRCRLRKLKT